MECPSIPDVAFFARHEAVAFNLWLHADRSPDAKRALNAAIYRSLISLDELEMVYPNGEEAFHNIVAELKANGLLKQTPKGWEVCDLMFADMAKVYKLYMSDEDFRWFLRGEVEEASNPKADASC